MAAKVNLVIEKGADFDPVFVWIEKDINGNEAPKDLTDYTAESHFREALDSPTPFLSCSTANGTIVLGGVNGTVQFKVPYATTEAIAASGGVWDIELKAPITNKKTRLLEGKVKVMPEVTHD